MSETYVVNLRKMAQALTELTKPRHEFIELEKCANCEECGTPIYPDYTLCAQCEESDEGPDPVDAQIEQEMEQERRVGW